MIILLLLTGCEQNEKVSIDLSGSMKNVKESHMFELGENPYSSSFSSLGIEYNGQASFDSFDYIYDGRISLKSKIVQTFDDGCLINAYIVKPSGIEIPPKRLSIGYFFIQKDKIVRLIDDKNNPWNIKEETMNRFLENRKLPADSQVVCSEQEILDKKSNGNNKGWHSSLSIDKDKRVFNCIFKKSNNEKKHSYFWETFIWKKDVGLIEYMCGYKEGVDFIWLLKDGYKSTVVE